MSRLKTLVFHYNRNLQVEAFKESFNTHCLEKRDVLILEQCCAELEHGVFKDNVLAELDGFEYIHFCVDDIIFTQDFSLDEVMESLSSNPDAIGFALLMGRNTDYCYMHDCKQPLPEFTGTRVLKYDWRTAKEDFGYPLQISSGVYRVSDLLPILDKKYFNSPNKLEAILSRFRGYFKKYYLLCFETSVGFCAPFNKVQTDFPKNRSMGYTPEFFEELYKNGSRIDTSAYSGIIPNGMHQEVELFLK